jgi:Domain of unknown function (DUF4261)
MSSTAASESPAQPSTPQYSATLICGRYTEIKLTQLIAAFRTIAPSGVIGEGAAPQTDALGTDVISLDGIALTLLNVDRPLSPAFFNTGPIRNQLTSKLLQRLRNHRAHVSVAPAQVPQDGSTALATARAVTLLSSAAAVVTRAVAVKWTDSTNFVPVSLLQGSAPMLSSAGGNAAAVWIRILLGRTRGRKMIAGSYGMWAFGLPEIEYAPTDLPLKYLVPHAWAVCDYILRSRVAVKHDDTIDVDRKNVFRIEAIEQGFFAKTRVLQLSWVGDSNSFNPSERNAVTLWGTSLDGLSP